MAITRENLKDIFREEIASEFQHIPENEAIINIHFSTNFINKMEKLFISQKQASWKYVNTAKKRVAVACLFIFILLTTACSIEEIREPFVRFIKEVHEDFIQYFFEGDTTKIISHKYEIYELPESFVRTDETKNDGRIFTVYENLTGEKIEFTQMVTKGTTHYLDTEQGGATIESVNDISVEFYEHSELITAIWIRDSYYFELTYYGSTTKEQLKTMIMSIK